MIPIAKVHRDEDVSTRRTWILTVNDEQNEAYDLVTTFPGERKDASFASGSGKTYCGMSVEEGRHQGRLLEGLKHYA